MLSEKVLAALNAQINMELNAFYTYLSASAFLESANFPGFASWMHHHAEEEMEHAMKIYHFVHERLGRVSLQAIPAPTQSWDTIKAVFEAAMHHEQKVTASINALVDLARSEKDHATEVFLHWFVKEQVEEEMIVDQVLQKLNLIGDFRPGLFMLDHELGEEAEGES